MTAGVLKSPPARSGSWKRRLGWSSLGALVALLAAALAAYLFPQQILTVDSGEVKADVLVVLGGGSSERPKRAAELFRQGAAPRILISGFGDSDSNARLLEKDGVPKAVITLERGSHTTRENATLSVPLLRQLGARRVIIVTSWFHSRRALRCFQHYAPDIQFYSRPSYYGYPRSLWRSEGITVEIRAEYRKLLGYWVRYGVGPL